MANQEIAESDNKLQAFSLRNAFNQIKIELSKALAKVFGQTGIGGFLIGPGILAAFDAITGRLADVVSNNVPTFKDGGYIGGNLHSQGGTIIEAERGEYLISRDRMAIPAVAHMAQELNNHKQSRGFKFQDGGFVGLTGLNRVNPETIFVPVLVTEDLDAVKNRVAVSEERATI